MAPPPRAVLLVYDPCHVDGEGVDHGVSNTHTLQQFLDRPLHAAGFK
jgi:hypothetical protein